MGVNPLTAQSHSLSKNWNVSENVCVAKCVHTSRGTIHASRTCSKVCRFYSPSSITSDSQTILELFSSVFGVSCHNMNRFDTKCYPAWTEGRKQPLKPKIKHCWVNERHLCLPKITTNVKGETYQWSNSTWYQIYSYYDIRNPKTGEKKALEKTLNQR